MYTRRTHANKPAATITSTNITNWNTAYTAEHPALTVNGNGLQLIGQQLNLTTPLQQLAGGRVLIGTNFSLSQDGNFVRLYKTIDGGITWTDTGTTLP